MTKTASLSLSIQRHLHGQNIFPNLFLDKMFILLYRIYITSKCTWLKNYSYLFSLEWQVELSFVVVCEFLEIIILLLQVRSSLGHLVSFWMFRIDEFLSAFTDGVFVSFVDFNFGTQGLLREAKLLGAKSVHKRLISRNQNPSRLSSKSSALSPTLDHYYCEHFVVNCFNLGYRSLTKIYD